MHGLGAVGDRAAADGHDQIRLRRHDRLGGRDHGRSRRVRRHPVEAAGTAVAERSAHLVDLVRRLIERVAHHQEDTRRP